MKRLMYTTALLCGTALAGAAAAETMVKEIEVEADLSTIENFEASKVWSTLPSDLESNIAERLSDRLGDEGAKIGIDIDEVSLANGFEQASGIANSQLKGTIIIEMPVAGQDMTYDLTVNAEQAKLQYPDGTEETDLTVGSEVFYNAMIDAFADNVASKFKEDM
ncbi:hypothetical protein SAMN05444007_103286 [Cribrihabitans marinus]|uniref:Uncharacterized protein n=1 Tax=Cribrihabitans marinus TaxID=1227549 RepID=A0A1H6W5W5_9RHOB|nr:hypothetical protein [Cribrihabitans marinus]GGH25132.1 hypothetical protein GCM10010973_12090 [Cribrihabitans marinus]SEJ08220.1 hypothetical protein SAMN05444007_103286 [Cribrihabitans marinus]